VSHAIIKGMITRL